MKSYKIYFKGKLIKEYKYRKCMIKYIYILRKIEMSRSGFHYLDDLLSFNLYVVDNFGQLYFV